MIEMGTICWGIIVGGLWGLVWAVPCAFISYVFADSEIGDKLKYHLPSFENWMDCVFCHGAWVALLAPLTTPVATLGACLASWSVAYLAILSRDV